MTPSTHHIWSSLLSWLSSSSLLSSSFSLFASLFSSPLTLFLCLPLTHLFIFPFFNSVLASCSLTLSPCFFLSSRSLTLFLSLLQFFFLSCSRSLSLFLILFFLLIVISLSFLGLSWFLLFVACS
jgi:hypothetical protein